MLRIARPLLNPASKLRLTRRTPHCPPPLLPPTLPNSRPCLPQQTFAVRAPTTFWTNYSTKAPLWTRDKAFEKETSKKILEARPDEVSTESSVRHVLEQSQAPPRSSEEDVLKGLKDDLHTFKETFALGSVPRESYILGLAGTIPYLATSIATIFLSWDLNTTWPTSSNIVNSFLIPHETASHWLHLLEPIQTGYGAVIISFLGAIHWGLEFAERSPSRERTRFRYGLGVVAPAVAWPTVFMPIEWALTTQFMAFTILYLADSRAATRGWAPQWYGTYRFVLTAVVGVAIFISLVGRARIGESRPRLITGELKDRIRQKPAGHKRHNWAKEEAEERVRLKKEEEEKRGKKEEEKKDEKKQKKVEEQTGGEEKQSGEKQSQSEEKQDGGSKQETGQSKE